MYTHSRKMETLPDEEVERENICITYLVELLCFVFFEMIVTVWEIWYQHHR